MSTDKTRFSLRERIEKMQEMSFGHSCAECGCQDFRKPSGPVDIPGGQRRYGVCRNCGARVVMVEKIETVSRKKRGKKQKD